MACDQWREMLSAQLDGEDDPAGRGLVDEHLAGCADCRAWLDRAAAVNRLTRTGIAMPVPDLSAAIMASLASSSTGGSKPGILASFGRGWRGSGGRARLATLLYVALAAVGAVQLILGLNQVGGGATGAHAHAGGANPGHLWHESAAWNVAVGAGYLFIALRRNRPSGLVPMLTAFVGMLLLLSLGDLTAGRVDTTRLISHGFVILGYLLVVALFRVAGETASPPGARSGWRAHFDDQDGSETTVVARALRLVPRQPGPLTASHDERRAA